MKATKAAIVCVLLADCEDPGSRETPVSDTLPILWARAAPESEETIERIEEIFGMEVVEVESAWGAFSVFVYEDGTEERNGRASGYIPCGGSAWARDDYRTLAHEIGHLAGLEHTDLEGHLMRAPADEPFLLTEQELQQVRQVAGHHEQCRIQGQVPE